VPQRRELSAELRRWDIGIELKLLLDTRRNEIGYRKCSDPERVHSVALDQIPIAALDYCLSNKVKGHGVAVVAEALMTIENSGEGQERGTVADLVRKIGDVS
jgi:hypothetical protein